MYVILVVLIAIDLVLLGGAVWLGFALSDVASWNLHVRFGFGTALLVPLVHVLAMFYFIGTGKDIRDAVEEHAELRDEFVPRTRELKRRVFPPAAFAITSIVLVALMGGEIDSRIYDELLKRGPPRPGMSAETQFSIPFGELGGWWIHLALVIVALPVNLWAFTSEVGAVRENRRIIQAINKRLAASTESTESTESTGKTEGPR